MTHTVLIVDDEVKLCDVTAMFCAAESINALKAHTGEDALRLFAENKVDLVLLDVMLPGMSGIDVCRAIRQTSEVPILFLSALNSDDFYLLGYRSGADDYITKPFSESVLMMKVKRILERNASGVLDRDISERGIEFDPTTRSCRIDGVRVHLTQIECDLLRILMQSAGRVVTRDTLLRAVWGYDFLGSLRVVDTHVMKLRKKLGTAADRIVTIISLGYRYEEEPLK